MELFVAKDTKLEEPASGGHGLLEGYYSPFTNPGPSIDRQL